MPVMPSFTGFASTPDLGGAFNQGRAIAQRAQEAQQQIQMQQQKLAQEAQQAAMEAQVKQQQLQQQALKDQQEIEVQKSYKESMIGLQQREVSAKEEMLNLSVQKAARSFQAQQMYQKEAEDLIASGVDPQKAFMQAALKFGPEMDLPGSAYAGAFRTAGAPAGGADMPEIGQILPVNGRDDVEQFVSGKGSRQLLKKTTGIKADLPAPEGFLKYGEKLVPDVALRDLKQERNRLIKLQDADIPGQSALSRKESGADLGRAAQINLKKFEERAAAIAELDGKLKGGRQPARRKPSQKSIDHLKQNPETADQFDAAFGDGASDEYLK